MERLKVVKLINIVLIASFDSAIIKVLASSFLTTVGNERIYEHALLAFKIRFVSLVLSSNLESNVKLNAEGNWYGRFLKSAGD